MLRRERGSGPFDESADHTTEPPCGRRCRDGGYTASLHRLPHASDRARCPDRGEPRLVHMAASAHPVLARSACCVASLPSTDATRAEPYSGCDPEMLRV